jgi:hypothetical protein
MQCTAGLVIVAGLLLAWAIWAGLDFLFHLWRIVTRDDINDV